MPQQYYSLFLFVVVIILISNTDQPTTTSSIVRPRPNPLSRTRSFIMANVTAITDYLFKFREHLHYANFHSTLNNMYAEPFEASVVNKFFTDAIINTLLLSYQAN